MWGVTMKTIFTTPGANMALVKTALVSGLLMAVGPGSVTAEPTEKKRDHALRDPLHFPTCAEPRGSRSRYGHLAGGGLNYHEHEGRENARQDVGAMHSVKR